MESFVREALRSSCCQLDCLMVGAVVRLDRTFC